MVAGTESKYACGTEQLCGGLETGTEGGIHEMQMICKQNLQEEDWGCLLIDVRNFSNA